MTQCLKRLKLGVINIQLENVQDVSVGSTVNRRAHCCLTAVTPVALSRSASAHLRLQSPDAETHTKNCQETIDFFF